MARRAKGTDRTRRKERARRAGITRRTRNVALRVW